MPTLRTTRRKCIRLANRVLASNRRLNRRLGADTEDKALRVAVIKHRTRLTAFKISRFQRMQVPA